MLACVVGWVDGHVTIFVGNGRVVRGKSATQGLRLMLRSSDLQLALRATVLFHLGGRETGNDHLPKLYLVPSIPTECLDPALYTLAS